MEDPMIEKIREEKNWLAKSLGIIAYHTLQQAGRENIRGKKWTVQDTANKLSMSVGYVSESIKLAKMSSRINFNGMTREKALEIMRSSYG